MGRKAAARASNVLVVFSIVGTIGILRSKGPEADSDWMYGAYRGFELENGEQVKKGESESKG